MERARIEVPLAKRRVDRGSSPAALPGKKVNTTAIINWDHQTTGGGGLVGGESGCLHTANHHEKEFLLSQCMGPRALFKAGEAPEQHGIRTDPPNSSPLPLTFMISHQVWFSWTDRFANVVAACRRKSSLVDLGPVLHRRVLRADYRLPPTRFKSAIDLFHLQPAAFLRGTRPSVVKDAAV